MKNSNRFILLVFAISFAMFSCNEYTEDIDLKMLASADVTEEQLIDGREAYQTYCIGCHGENGDGKGPASKFFVIQPRDFTSGVYKFASVPAGEVPHDIDIYNAIDKGLARSSMPSWRFLSSNTKKALVAYLKTFSPDTFSEPPGTRLSIPQNPFAGDPEAELEAVELGKAVYHGFTACYSCHPSYASPDEINSYREEIGQPARKYNIDLYEEKYSETVWGDTIIAPDFLKRKLKNGNDLQTLLMTIQAGIGGTAMPSWAGILPDEDLWAMAYFVRSLSIQQGTPEGKKSYNANQELRKEIE